MKNGDFIEVLCEMGTNCYMFTTNKEIANKYAPHSFTLVDSPCFGYEFHVVKVSLGWLPLFQAHEDGIKSVKQYKEAYDTGEIIIYDEYEKEYTWEEFDEEFIQHEGGRVGVKEPKKIRKSSKKGDNDVPIDTDMPDYIPVSHIPGTKQSYKYSRECFSSSIFSDDEGYEFDLAEFC